MSVAHDKVGQSGIAHSQRNSEILRNLDHALGWITELPAALLLVAEVLILFAGVIGRYVFDHPLVWSTELAETLFLWLAMFGAAIALRRDEHMRMTVVLARVPPAVRAWGEALTAMVVLVFLIDMIVPAGKYAADQWPILSPALQVHDTFRVGALLVGFVLMLLIALVRLVSSLRPQMMLGALAIVFAFGAALWVARPAIVAMGNANLLIFFVALIAICVFVGIPIAFSFGVASVAYFATATSIPPSLVIDRIAGGTSNFILTSIPLFILLGYLMQMGGLARVLVEFLAALVGHLRAGLSYVLLGAMFLVSGISGAKSADMAAIAPVLLPEMMRRGGKPGELVAQLASSAAMAETIPPSVVLIIIGSVTGVSISGLFTGGLLPAVVAALALVVVVYLRAAAADGATGRRATTRTIWRSFWVAIPALVLPLLIRAAVIYGVATATEVATIGVAYTIAVAVVFYRSFDIRRLYSILVETASLSGAILFIIATATVMAWALTQSGFAQQLVRTMAHVPGGVGGFLAISIVVFIILGSVLEGIPAIVLFGPLLFPAARTFGINEVHYAIVVILAMGIGLFAPPFGVGFYSACAIARVSPDESMTRIFPYLAAVAGALLIVAAVPWLSTGFLPKTP